MLLTEMPTYLTSIVGFNLQKSGAVAVLPYLACFAGSVVFGAVADRLVKRHGWRVRSVRIAMAAVAEAVPALCIAGAGFFSNATVIVALLTFATGFSGASSASYASSYIDLAPRNAGMLLSMGNTLATFPGVLAPLTVGAIVAAPNDDAQHWRTVFLMAAAIAAAGFGFYARFIDDAPLAFWGGSAVAATTAAADSAEADEAETAGLVKPS